MVAHAFNTSTLVAETGRTLEFSGLQSEFHYSQGYTEKPCLILKKKRRRRRRRRRKGRRRKRRRRRRRRRSKKPVGLVRWLNAYRQLLPSLTIQVQSLNLSW